MLSKSRFILPPSGWRTLPGASRSQQRHRRGRREHRVDPGGGLIPAVEPARVTESARLLDYFFADPVPFPVLFPGHLFRSRCSKTPVRGERPAPAATGQTQSGIFAAVGMPAANPERLCALCDLCGETVPHLPVAVSYTHLRAHETDSYLVCRLLLEK